MSNNVLIFTKRVLPISNTFVAAQAQHLNKFTPTFIGFKPDKSGRYLIKDQRTCIQSEHEKRPYWSKFLLEAGGYLTRSWKDALQKCEPHLIHAHFGKGGFYSAAIADQLDLPLAVTFHGSDITQRDKFSYNQKHRNRVYSRANKIIASSEFIAHKLLQNGCPEDKLIQHYIGIDNDYFSPQDNKSGVPLILFVGRLIKQKGCHLLLQTMEQINQLIPQAQLVIAGDGVERKALEQQASRLNNVTFVGYQSKQQIKQLMSQAWLMCAPSIVLERGNEEGLGMVFLEAQAMATPVVSFATGGVSEAVKNNQTGLLVKPNCVKSLTDAVYSLLSSNTMRAAFSEAALAHIEQNFNLKKQTNKFEKIYHNLI